MEVRLVLVALLASASSGAVNGQEQYAYDVIKATGKLANQPFVY